MGFNLADLIASLDVRRMGADVYEGTHYDLGHRRIFGGQLLAQGVRSLHESSGGKQIKSITQYFPRPGYVDEPVTYRVDTAHDGRTFATRAVRAQQGERTIGVMTASLHTPEAGIERTEVGPDVVPPGWARRAEIDLLPWEVRVLDDGDLRDPADASPPPSHRFWMRVPDLADHGDAAGADQQWLHQALLAHASAATAPGTVTTHSIWFHASVRMDQWLLVDQHSPTMSGGRVFSRADLWTVDGRLVASVAQESTVSDS